ncbi:hypothetical protein TH25_23900 [Thalassospira profundimaris]|uniref:Uncharacterized protein n=1 Tax=Thalassospira profundimaris TaxID=502049 RepID=A0A367WKR3_9PROT|nr:hypothetical protein TH25_23900 [Thalassospira profundimaris]
MAWPEGKCLMCFGFILLKHDERVPVQGRAHTLLLREALKIYDFFVEMIAHAPGKLGLSSVKSRQF